MNNLSNVVGTYTDTKRRRWLAFLPVRTVKGRVICPACEKELPCCKCKEKEHAN